MTTREQVHHLIDQLPEQALPAVVVYLQDLQAGEPAPIPLLQAMSEAEEAEPEPDELAAIADYHANLVPSRSWEEVKTDLAL